MGLRIIKTGSIDCDKCGKKLAKIFASEKTFKVHVDEARFNTVRCIECDANEQ